MESMLICGNMFINHIMWTIQSIYAHIDGKKCVHVQFQGLGINLEPWKLLKLKVCFCFFCQINKIYLFDNKNKNFEVKKRSEDVA